MKTINILTGWYITEENVKLIDDTIKELNLNVKTQYKVKFNSVTGKPEVVAYQAIGTEKDLKCLRF